MQPTAAMIALAVERLGTNEETARLTCHPAPGIEDACIFSDSTGRGARRLLVTRDLETLGAASGISPERHVAAFQSGLRS